MKTKLNLVFMLVAGLSTSVFANSERACGQQNARFLEVVGNYQACNSVIGSDPSACNRFCADADKLINSGYGGGGSCSMDQIREYENRARAQGQNEGRQQGRDEVLRDLSVREDYISPDYYGINEADCAQRASQSSQRLRMEAVARCNNKAQSIRNCFIRDEKVTGTFGRPPKFEGAASFKKEDNRSNEEECRRTALAEATNEVLRACNEATGTQCSISERETILTHRLQQPSGPRLGRRDTRICDAKVFAEAPRDLAYKCNVRISARNQAFNN